VDLLKSPTPADLIVDTLPGHETGSPSDVARLFREHNAALLRFAAARLGSEHEAREVAQEAYVRLLQLDRRQTIGFLRAYLFKTAANLATDRLRARRRAPSHSPVREALNNPRK
jgi:DNA-directed RNA polymerase specialized sigma24 family protein